ncbi:hypothetical protein J1605_000287 [Eschrichtius robustus]|uniref:Uncharacterized protein n=1 Tax=Eschrichtius robustus TaxID=9764 RepID=A0AB34HKB0_ESCRO|nr:hypothetical protein J1605_000287 [Eschrichtius robustus]
MGVSSWLWNLILLPCPEATRRFPPAPFAVIFLSGTPGEGARLVSAQPESGSLRIAPSSANSGAAAATTHLAPAAEREELLRGSGGARRFRRGSEPGRGGQRTRRRTPGTPGGAAPFPAPPPGPREPDSFPRRPLNRATFLRLPPAAVFGGSMLLAPRERQQPAGASGDERAESSGPPAPEPGTTLRSSRRGLGG